jgi:hypothetical protein
VLRVPIATLVDASVECFPFSFFVFLWILHVKQRLIWNKSNFLSLLNFLHLLRVIYGCITY